MIPRVLALVLLLAASACGGSDAPGPDRAPSLSPTGFTSRTCADVVIVGVRGQQQSPKVHHGVGTEVYRIATELTSRLQDAGEVSVRLEGVDYESAPAPDLDAYDDAVADAVDRLSARLDRLERGCPDSRLAVIGFSMGAQVVHEAVHDREVGNLAVVAMVADPFRDPVAPYVQFTFGTAAPNPGSLGAGPAFGEELAERTASFCAAADDVCNHTAGTSRTAVDVVHKHFYEEPEHAAAIAGELARIARVAR